MKRCKRCGIEKPLDEFYADKGGRDGRRPECKACNLDAQKERYRADPQKYIDRVKRWQRENREAYNAKQRRWRAENADRIREGHLRRKYGITQADYERMLADQGGGCAICGDPPPESVSLHVDHDHESGAIRGLLCVRCNNALGLLREESGVLALVEHYLAEPGAVKVAGETLASQARQRAFDLRRNGAV
ncbi:MAG TPA: endonuclease VII domain-containing protein [Acidimicrobiia bacterium]|nr:endonuclease VII domain-containing protein [Acidimicrobiia bacterium]